MLYALSFNKGEALAWKQMIVTGQESFLKDLAQSTKDHEVGLWEAAKLLFTKVFCLQSMELEAQQRLLHIRQGNKTVEQYCTKFRLVGSEANLARDMTLVLWKQGLKPVIKQKIYESGNIPTTFNEWGNRAKAIDLGWREYQLERGPISKERQTRRTFEPANNQRTRLSDEEYQK